MCTTVQTSDSQSCDCPFGDAGTRSGLNESHQGPPRGAPSLHAPLLRLPRISRRARSGGMSRTALFDPHWQVGADKTRVSSINRRRVTTVPGESRCFDRGRDLGARAELDGSSRGVDTEVAVRVARPRPRHPDGWLERPHCTIGGMSSGLRLRAWIAIQSRRRRGFAGSADQPLRPLSRADEDPRRVDPFGPPPGGPVSTPSLRSWRSAGSSPAGTGPHASIARCSALALPDLSQAALLLRARRTTMLSPSTRPLSRRSRAVPR